MHGRDFALGFASATAVLLLIGFLFLPAYNAQVITSPGAEPEFISLISSARESILIENYIITSDEVVDALENASARGVDVRIILEKRVSGGTNMEAYDELSAAGIRVQWAPFSFKLVHSKLIIIDGQIAVVGSHNLSNSALTDNREISVLLQGGIVSELVKLFERDWESPGY